MKKRSMRKSASLLLAGTLCAALAGCSQASQTTADSTAWEETASTEQQETVENPSLPAQGEAVVEDNYEENLAAGRIASKGFAVFGEGDTFHPYTFTRHALGDDDILIEIMYASICHSDLHAAWAENGASLYPMVPGHEMVGVVTEVGANVTKFKVGDYAAMGPMANFDEETGRTVWTYNSIDSLHDGEPAMGGYSDNMVVDEDYAIPVPANADLEKIAPLACAGITVYSPITFSEVQPGDKVGVAGFGGLGDMAVRFLQAIGTDITAFDVNEDKRQLAADMGISFVNVNNEEELQGLNNSFDFIISTIPASYDPMLYIQMLKEGGELAIVGQPPADADASISVAMLPFAEHRYVYGSLIGTIEETAEMIQYCVDNHIYPDVELIPATAESIDQVFELLGNSEGEFRYVMDMRELE